MDRNSVRGAAGSGDAVTNPKPVAVCNPSHVARGPDTAKRVNAALTALLARMEGK